MRYLRSYNWNCFFIGMICLCPLVCIGQTDSIHLTLEEVFERGVNYNVQLQIVRKQVRCTEFS